MIKITGYTDKFLPISVVKAIRVGTGVGLAEGKSLMEAVVEGREVLLTASKGISEQSLVDDLRAVGVKSEIVQA